LSFTKKIDLKREPRLDEGESSIRRFVVILLSQKMLKTGEIRIQRKE